MQTAKPSNAPKIRNAFQAKTLKEGGNFERHGASTSHGSVAAFFKGSSKWRESKTPPSNIIVGYSSGSRPT